MTHCTECGFVPKAKTEKRAAAAVLQHFRRKHGIAPDGVIRDCEHESVHHEHGTNKAYVMDACRCAACREAARVHRAARARAIAYGRFTKGKVLAGTARAHVMALNRGGTTLRHISAASGVPFNVIKTLIYGRGETGPVKKIKKHYADDLLAVTPFVDHVLYTDGTGTRRRIQALVAVGYSFSVISRSTGIASPNLQHIAHGRRDMVLRTTEAKVRAAYDLLWDAPCPTGGYAGAVATKAMNLAAANGWVPPMAWDDDEIDDPSVRKPRRRDVVRR